MDNNIVLKHLISIILMLYGNSSLPRKIVQTVLDSFTNLINNAIFVSLKADILQALQNENISIKKIDRCFDKYTKILESVNTEHKRFNILRKYEMIDFKEYIVDSLIVKKNR